MPLLVVLQAALWIGAGIGAAWIAIWAFRQWAEARRATAAPAAAPAAGPLPAAAAPAGPPPLDAIDALSAEGRHGAAVHALLLRAIADVSRLRG
jgi:hypothetical protein